MGLANLVTELGHEWANIPNPEPHSGFSGARSTFTSPPSRPEGPRGPTPRDNPHSKWAGNPPPRPLLHTKSKTGDPRRQGQPLICFICAKPGPPSCRLTSQAPPPQFAAERKRTRRERGPRQTDGRRETETRTESQRPRLGVRDTELKGLALIIRGPNVPTCLDVRYLRPWWSTSQLIPMPLLGHDAPCRLCL